MELRYTCAKWNILLRYTAWNKFKHIQIHSKSSSSTSESTSINPLLVYSFLNFILHNEHRKRISIESLKMHEIDKWWMNQVLSAPLEDNSFYHFKAGSAGVCLSGGW